MSRDGEMERLLGSARVETTKAVDERVLERAARGLSRPFWGPLAAAAALIVVALTPVFLPEREAETPVADQPVFTVVLGSRVPLGIARGIVVTSNESLSSVQVANLDDVTNGLEDKAAGGYVNMATPVPVLGPRPAKPAAGLPEFGGDRPVAGSFFLGKGKAGDFRGRTENLFFGGTSFGLTRLVDGHDSEQYDATAEAGFRDPRHEPLSTFSIDVDTASMANVRRFLAAGRMPPKGAVRIEEMINYFSYDYPEPTGDAPFSVTTEVAACPWAPGHRLVHIGIQGKRMTADEIPARNLVFLLDVSGSMRSPDKLTLVKAAMTLLVAQLRGIDRVGIVVYAGASGVVLEPTSGANSQAILGALDRLSAGGSTNGGAGIRLAYDLAKRYFDAEKINRVILATDGDFNVGTTSRDELHALIEEQRKSGVFLTVLGVGTGNIKDSQMEMLADRGNGNYAYLDTLAEAKKVLVDEAGGTLVTIAKDVKIQVEFNPDKVGAYRLIGYENRVLAARDFNDDRKDAGEIGAGHSVTAIYEIAGPEDRKHLVDPLKYQKPYVPGDRNYGDEVLTAKLRYKQPDGEKSRLLEYPLRDPGEVTFGAASRDFQFSAAVAAFGLLLRGSEHRGQASYGMVEELIHATLGEDPFGYRKELLSLVVTAKGLTAGERD